MKLVGTIVVMIGIILVYDARQISRRVFSISDLNSATFWCKVSGFMMFVIGGFLILFA